MNALAKSFQEADHRLDVAKRKASGKASKRKESEWSGTKIRRAVGVGLVVVGLLFVAAGLGITPPLSVVSIGPTSVTDVPPRDALRVYAGLMLVLIGSAIAFGKEIVDYFLAISRD